jgi:outer membrane lipoprotein SlyB
MEGVKVLEKQRNLLYPLMLIAAITVIVFSIVGIATMLGWLPSVQSMADPASRANAGSGLESAPVRALPAGAAADRAPAPAPCANCGVIESIHVVESKGEGSGVGAVTGGVVGGIVGNQVGRGSGRAVMTVVGAGAGAYAGHEIEKNVKRSTQYQIGVRMGDGTLRTFSQQTPPAFGAGQKVQVTESGLVAAR